MQNKISRRTFFEHSALASAGAVATGAIPKSNPGNPTLPISKIEQFAPTLPSPYALDLAPAKWIWYPCQRTLANTFILFRKEFALSDEVRSARGWILGDSRYLLAVNGQRIQWGPAPSDPRYAEADPLDLTKQLKKGKNVIGSTVLYYGLGDGTWPTGKPGFIFQLHITTVGGEELEIISDHSWQCHLARSWQPGQYKRWYLRALQEEFDARYYPYSWTTSSYSVGEDWLSSAVLKGSADKPALNTNSADYLYNSSGGGSTTELRKRSVPMLIEQNTNISSLVEALSIQWQRPIYEYFEMIPPNAYTANLELDVVNVDKGSWDITMNEDKRTGVALLFDFKEQIVGWPYFTVTASAGTEIELLVQEGHVPFSKGGVALMNNHFNSWTRFICKEGVNHFQTFDFESVKWLQLHIHGSVGKVRIEKVGLKRRLYDWKKEPMVTCSNQDIQSLIEASLNTIYNNAQETIADGMGRERQQYSGDIGHELHALYSVFGEEQLPARYINTFSQGLTLDGFFLDTWPAYDRLNRLAQRQLGLTPWGPLLDHGIQFNFDCYHHLLYTGRSADLQEVFPRLQRFFTYLKNLVRDDQLLPVEDLGVPTVWMDTDAYLQQRHKQCAFNLYAAAMLQFAFAKLCQAFGEHAIANEALILAESLHTATVKKFWDPRAETFICNMPWLSEEGAPRMCERSLSLAILYDLCPDGNTKRTVDVLVEIPDNLGRCYPANANWTLWALARAGKTEAIFADFKNRWLKMDSVKLNNTMQETWTSKPDSRSQWSHAAIGPLLSVFMDLAGIRPTEKGFQSFQIRPQLGSIDRLELTNHTPKGPILFKASGELGKRRLALDIPKGIQGELIIDQREQLQLPAKDIGQGHKAFELEGGRKYDFTLRYS